MLFKVFFYRFSSSNVEISFQPLYFASFVQIFAKFDSSLPQLALIVVITVRRLIADKKFIAGTGFVPGCKISGNTKPVVESKIREASTRARISNVKKLLTGALLNSIGDADDDKNNSNVVPISQIGGCRDLVVDVGIVKILTETGIDRPKIVDYKAYGAETA